ncbi:MAG: long-chain-fatty-acid--CoA ligase [Syntrophobacteraceae bacterium]
MIIGKIISKRALISPDREALIFNGKVYTFGELNERSNRLANSMLGLGVEQGDRVGVLMYNSNEFLEIYFAASKIGAVLVPLNIRLSAPEMDFILEDCGVSHFFLGSGFEAKALEMETPGRMRNNVSTGPSAVPGALDYETLVHNGAPEGPSAVIGEDDLNVIMYTSGTTGHPKGAMLTHRGMYSAGVDMVIGLSYTYPDRCLILGPFFHSGAITPFLGHVVRGICSVIMERFEPSRALQLIEKYNVKLMLGVTTIMKMMLQAPNIDSCRLDCWKYAILPGSPLPYELIKEAHERIGVLCQNLWGLTEMCGPGALMNIEDAFRKPESAGKPYFNVDIRIIDAEGADLPRGAPGEIIVRAPHVMQGYWNRPDDTRKTIRDGWLYTGDIGKFDEEGYLYVIDRAKDMLISGGENVYPAEIERVIRALPGVLDVSAIGIPDEKWGQAPKVFIERDPDAQITPETVIAHCRANLAGYKTPKAVEFIDKLPRTPSGKVLKRELRNLP